VSTLIFDGDCGFCRLWVEFARGLTVDAVEYVPYQTAAERFPETPVEEFKKAVQYLTPTEHFSAAEAVFRLLAGVPGYRWMLWAYLHLPAFAILSEIFYGFVARHRDGFYRVTRVLWGRHVVRSTYHLSSAYFTRALSLVYLVAFASFGMQVRGLVGSEGILPVNAWFRIAHAELGAAAYWRIPSIFWWTHSDLALLSIAWGGVALSAISMLARPHSRWQRLIFILLYVYYLSIVSAGQIFMSYQWDLLLLETGFLAIFLRPSLPRVWLFQWLLVRLMFGSGLVKIMSHDPSWRDLSALAVHYETQPLPTLLAWYANQLPLWFQKASTALTLGTELALPVLMLLPRRLKHIAAFGTITLQVLILLTGNYTFFNFLTLALCLFLFDDAFFAGKLYKPVVPARSNFAVSAVLVAVVMTLSFVALDVAAPFGIVNRYGLFAVMTTKRPEVEIEGSNDGQTWLPYIFRNKSGPLNRAPGWVAPFQPRLDWQMWFAALGSFRENPWFVRFAIALLEGSKPVLALLERDPFGGKPPRQIRAVVYEYHFTTFEEKRRTGNWWKREEKGMYFPPVGLRK
jgi:predicted DCC family thiol-disulfide oxidoreductase YuxK